jgi:hypothetical protein
MQEKFAGGVYLKASICKDQRKQHAELQDKDEGLRAKGKGKRLRTKTFLI